MDTDLHRKIKSMCSIDRSGAGHWMLVGCKTMWVSDVQDIVTTKRAAYAAFIGQIPEGQDVFAECGKTGCIAPAHAVLRRARRAARALELPGRVEALSMPDRFTPAEPVDKIPDSVSLYKINLVKFLRHKGNSTSQMQEATGLPRVEIVKIVAGRYDELAKTLAAANTQKNDGKNYKKAKSSVELSGARSSGAVATNAEYDDHKKPPVIDRATEEEIAWLNQQYK